MAARAVQMLRVTLRTGGGTTTVEIEADPNVTASAGSLTRSGSAVSLQALVEDACRAITQEYFARTGSVRVSVEGSRIVSVP